MEIRQLDRRHSGNLFDLLSRRDNLWKLRNLELLPQGAEGIVRRLADPGIIYVGAFDGADLIGCICAREWKSSPYYTICDWTILNNSKSFGLSKKVMIGVMDRMIHIMEARGRFTIYALTARAYFPRRILNRDDEFSAFGRFVPAMRDYRFTTEAIIPAGTFPDFEVYREMMGNKSHQIDLVLRRIYKSIDDQLLADFQQIP